MDLGFRPAHFQEYLEQRTDFVQVIDLNTAMLQDQFL